MNKQELEKYVYQILSKHPKGQFESYTNEITKQVNIDNGKPLMQGGHVPSNGISLTKQEIETIQEIIWDLIIARIVTPGMDRSNDQWPFLRVTNLQSLQQKM